LASALQTVTAGFYNAGVATWHRGAIEIVITKLCSH